MVMGFRGRSGGGIGAGRLQVEKQQVAVKSVTERQRLQAEVTAASATVRQPFATESVTERQRVFAGCGRGGIGAATGAVEGGGGGTISKGNPGCAGGAPEGADITPDTPLPGGGNEPHATLLV